MLRRESEEFERSASPSNMADREGHRSREAIESIYEWREEGTCLQHNHSQKSGPQTRASASLGNMLEVYIPMPYPRPAEKHTLGVGPSSLCFPKLSGRLRCSLKF